MSLQHYYSRVPARISLFNKSDGFDTFGFSEGLSREFIEKELAVVYDNVPNKTEAVLIRDGKMSPVYCQRVTKAGEMIQSRVTFFPRDYTGERSSYFTHSVVLNEAEQNAAFCGTDITPYNPALFVSSVTAESMNDPSFTSSETLPEVAYAPAPAVPATELVSKYEPKMIKRLIYAAINLVYNKGKPLYFIFDVPHEELSEKALSFFGSLMQVFPYHVRKAFSFVTDAGDFSKYNAFKLKGLPVDSPDVPASKGITFNFVFGNVMGVREDELTPSLPLIDFFFGMMQNDAVRREFLLFVDHAVKVEPALAAPTLKVLNELVFLFKKSCGMYPDSQVIPNEDKIYEFIVIYEKYRNAMTDEYRLNALRFLHNYPASHTAIPKKVFPRVTKIYSTEPTATKHFLMNVMLDLIHTDAMREKVFTFLKNVYDAEDEETKRTINTDISSVYYGGFLQPQIIDFFTAHFETEPEATQTEILKKLLLTIRTEAVQPRVVAFLASHYETFTAEQKEMFFKTFCEMLPECDNLASALVDIVNERIVNDEEATRLNLAAKVVAAVEADQKKIKSHEVLSFLAARPGFCGDALVEKIFREWNTRKAFDDYCNAMATKNLQDMINSVLSVWEKVPDMSQETSDRFLSAFTREESLSVRQPLFDLLTAEAFLNDEVIPKMDAPGADFLNRLIDGNIHPKIEKAVCDVFKPTKFAEGMPALLAYAKAHPYLAKSDAYKPVSSYRSLLYSFSHREFAKVLPLAMSLPAEKAVRNDIAMCLGTENSLIAPEGEAKEERLLLYYALSDYLKRGTPNFANAYTKTLPSVDGADDAARTPLLLGALLRVTDAVSAEETVSMLVADSSGIASTLRDAVVQYGKKLQKSLLADIAATVKDETVRNTLTQAVNNAQPKSSGFLAGLFKKK